MNEEEAIEISCLFSGITGTCKSLFFYETFCRQVCEKYPEISVICITKGPRGAAVYHKRIYEEVETIPVEVENTVGAGDAFSASFFFTYLSGYAV